MVPPPQTPPSIWSWWWKQTAANNFGTRLVYIQNHRAARGTRHEGGGCHLSELDALGLCATALQERLFGTAAVSWRWHISGGGVAIEIGWGARYRRRRYSNPCNFRAWAGKKTRQLLGWQRTWSSAGEDFFVVGSTPEEIKAGNKKDGNGIWRRRDASNTAVAT